MELKDDIEWNHFRDGWPNIMIKNVEEVAGRDGACVYVCVFMSVCKCVYMCVCVRAHAYVRVCIRVCVHLCITFVSMYPSLYKHSSLFHYRMLL